MTVGAQSKKHTDGGSHGSEKHAERGSNDSEKHADGAGEDVASDVYRHDPKAQVLGLVVPMHLLVVLMH